MCVCVCVCVCVTQELASRERFIIDSTDPFAIVRMYVCACVYTCVHVCVCVCVCVCMCVCVSLTSKDMVRLIRSSWGVRRFVQGGKARARVCVCVCVCVRVPDKQEHCSTDLGVIAFIRSTYGAKRGTTVH